MLSLLPTQDYMVKNHLDITIHSQTFDDSLPISEELRLSVITMGKSGSCKP
jgi:hypothetical protein